MEFLYKKSFLKKFDSYDTNYQQFIVLADKDIREYYVLRKASFGLRIKKLYDNGKEKVYEGRVNEQIRIVWVETINIVVFSLLGNHDDVKRYIKVF